MKYIIALLLLPPATYLFLNFGTFFYSDYYEMVSEGFHALYIVKMIIAVLFLAGYLVFSSMIFVDLFRKMVLKEKS